MRHINNKIHLPVDQLWIISQKYPYLDLDRNKFLKFVYEFEFQNVLVNLY